MNARSGYPAGVPCWVDVIQHDVEATMAFYGELFGWDFDVRSPDGAPSRYAYATIDGLLVAGVGGPSADASEPGGWTTYLWVDSADETAAAVKANGGSVLADPADIPRAGRVAVCADPSGALFGLWQAAENRGVQLVNAPGSWSFNELSSTDLDRAETFYGAVFGWEREPLELGAGRETFMWRVPGYGKFLAESDPEIRRMQESAPAPGGFADAVALASPLEAGAGPDQWSVTFGVADADGAFARATELGAKVVTAPYDTDYTRQGTISDPQGALLTLSQFRPPVTSE